MVEEPFKNREELKARIKLCSRWSDIGSTLSFLFVVIGIIWRVLKIDYGLDSTFWFLLAIFFAVIIIMPTIHLVGYKQLYGIESENKNK